MRLGWKKGVRHVVVGSWILFMMLASPSWGEAPKVVSGRVVLDANENGRIDDGEKGIAGVILSDGVNLVRSKDDGSYEITVADDPVIPYKPAQVISMSWPSGTWPTSKWFRRLSDVNASENVDFTLRMEKQRLPFTIVHATDPHNNFSGEKNRVWRQEIANMRDAVDFCIITGDLGYAGPQNADKMFTSIQRFTQSFPIPMFHTPGNHDIVGIHQTWWSKPSDIHGNGAFTKYLGPIRWSFNYAGVHVIGVDWARIVDKKLETGIPKVAIDWFEKDLKQLKSSTRKVAFIHSQYSPDPAFYKLVRKYKVELILAGHSHRNLDLSIPGVKILTTMNLRGPYRLVQLNEKGFDVINRCIGCKDPEYHSRHCKLKQYPDLSGRRGRHAELSKVLLQDATRAVDDFRGKSLEIAAEFQSEGAKKFGLRLMSVDGRKELLEIAFSGNELHTAGIRIAAVRHTDQKTFRLRVVLDDGAMRLWVNGRVQFDKRLEIKDPVTLRLFAQGGKARVKKFDVWELRIAR